MSIYDNETKIYSDLNPAAPQEPQTCRIKKLTEIDAFFLDEIVDTGLITSAVITGGISIAAFASGVDLPVGIALSGTSLLLSLATVTKHDSIKLLAQNTAHYHN